MKGKIIYEKNENGLYSKLTTKEQTPKDGFVYQNNEHIATSRSETDNPTRSVWHKGYAKKISYTTNDPRITRPFVYTVCGIFLLIGIILLLFRSWFMGIVFTTGALFTFFNSKKDIDTIENDLRARGHDMDSKEKKEEVRQEVNEIIKNGFEDAKKSTFTKETYKWFFKTSVPIYCIIVTVTSLFLTIVINWIFGLVAFGICLICGIFFYYIVLKICKN